MKKIVSIVATLCSLFYGAMALQADASLENKACRSVHLIYPAPEAVAFYNEVTVQKSSPGTYFMATGFSGGYFGIQELYDGKKLIIFSVWDPGDQNDPDQVKEEHRVKMIYKDTATRVGRFGNEGTGGQSFYDYDWKVGETYRFCVSVQPDGKWTEYTGWFFFPETQEWKKLVTFSTLTPNKSLVGLYSFIEDFYRNGKSAQQILRAQFGNGWVVDKNGQYHSINRAQFSGDSNPSVNINAGVDEDRFFLQTGGDTQNMDTLLWKYINRVPPGVKLPDFASPVKDKKVEAR